MVNRLLALLFGLGLLLNQSYAQTLTVSGDVKKPMTLGAGDLKAMPHTDVMGKDKDGKEHRYSGVPLIEFLRQAGVSVGSELRGANLSRYVIIKAADGYKAVFALPELDPEFATRTILLADAVDGVAIPKGAGPYRIVVPDEKKPARWVRDVTAIEVRLAN